MKHSLAVLALLGAVVLPASPAAAACDVTVRFAGYAPASHEIARGGTVTWCWAEGNHSVTGEDFADSGVRAKDATFTHTFATAGTFSYVCSVHGSMTGQIVVKQAAATTPPVSKSPSVKPSTKPATTPPATPARTSSPVPRAQASTTPAVIPTSPQATTAPPTTAAPTSAPATTEPPATTDAPSPSATTVADIDPAPAKPKTGLAIALGLVVAAGALGGAAWLLLRGRGA